MTPEEERDQLARGIPPQWASAWGEDEHGAYACFEVNRVEQRMRWIEGGRFRMGSPKGEVGRWEDEGPQHEVELRSGYWLADTPCTQALWQAVMGSNPSRFPGPRRPVEKVSWNDVQAFLGRLNELVPGLDARLPTEAEWEHACRAGTETATYKGDLRDKGRDAVLDDIAWYGGNSGGQSHDVGLKRPNDWGLYDMLGNMYEWCADSLRTYESADAPIPDPESLRDPWRVIRGGSWSSDARLVRAARRNGYRPGDRDEYLGFRLSRGQGLRQPAQPGPEG